MLAYEPDMGKVFHPIFALGSYFAYNAYYAVPYVSSAFITPFALALFSGFFMLNVNVVRSNNHIIYINTYSCRQSYHRDDFK